MPDCNTCKNYEEKKKDNIEIAVKTLLAEFKIYYANFSSGVEIANQSVYTPQLEALMSTGAKVYYSSSGKLKIYWKRY